MSTSKLMVVPVVAIGAAIAGFVRSSEMPQQTTARGIRDHAGQTGGQSELASLASATNG